VARTINRILWLNIRTSAVLPTLCCAVMTALAFPSYALSAQEWGEEDSAEKSKTVSSSKTTGLTLDQVLDLAFSKNPDMQAAEERIGQAEARVIEATANFYPKLMGQVGYTYTDNPALAFSAIVAQRRFTTQDFGNINNPGYIGNFRPELVGTMSLFEGGRDYYRKKAAELGVEVHELERAALRNQLTAAVTAAYYAVLTAPREVEAARRSLAAVDSELKHARDMHAAGSLLRSDVLSLEVRYGQARERELQTLNAQDSARTGLKTLLGLGTGDSIEVRESLKYDKPPQKALVENLLNTALAQRPEMQIAARQVEMREKELRAEIAGHMPRVDAYAAYGLNEQSPQFNFSKQNVTVGINAQIEIFGGGATSARVSAAERKVAEALAVRERVRLDIDAEVQRAQHSLSEVESRLQVMESAQTSAEEALRLVHEQYRAGAAGVTRYLEAEADRTASEMRALTARFEVQIARANLQKAVGSWFESDVGVGH
jgi:outer membrane protein